MLDNILDVVYTKEIYHLHKMSSSSEDIVSDAESRSADEGLVSKVQVNRAPRASTPEESIKRMSAVLERIAGNLQVVMEQQRGMATQ